MAITNKGWKMILKFWGVAELLMKLVYTKCSWVCKWRLKNLSGVAGIFEVGTDEIRTKSLFCTKGHFCTRVKKE